MQDKLREYFEDMVVYKDLKRKQFSLKSLSFNLHSSATGFSKCLRMKMDILMLQK